MNSSDTPSKRGPQLPRGYSTQPPGGLRLSELVAASGDDVEAKEALTSPPFGYTDDVASDVLNMQLRRLTRSWRHEAKAELLELNALLKDDGH